MKWATVQMKMFRMNNQQAWIIMLPKPWVTLSPLLRIVKKDELCGHGFWRYPRQGNLHRFIKLFCTKLGTLGLSYERQWYF